MQRNDTDTVNKIKDLEYELDKATDSESSKRLEYILGLHKDLYNFEAMFNIQLGKVSTADEKDKRNDERELTRLAREIDTIDAKIDDMSERNSSLIVERNEKKDDKMDSFGYGRKQKENKMEINDDYLNIKLVSGGTLTDNELEPQDSGKWTSLATTMKSIKFAISKLETKHSSAELLSQAAINAGSRSDTGLVSHKERFMNLAKAFNLHSDTPLTTELLTHITDLCTSKNEGWLAYSVGKKSSGGQQVAIYKLAELRVLESVGWFEFQSLLTCAWTIKAAVRKLRSAINAEPSDHGLTWEDLLKHLGTVNLLLSNTSGKPTLTGDERPDKKSFPYKANPIETLMLSAYKYYQVAAARILFEFRRTHMIREKLVGDNKIDLEFDTKILQILSITNGKELAGKILSTVREGKYNATSEKLHIRR